MSATVDRKTLNMSVVLTAEQQRYIVECIVKGTKSITQICTDLKISVHHVYDYAFKDPIFSKRMEQARVYQSHTLVDELLHITHGAETMAAVAKSKVISDNIKWSSGKFAPQIYGENINVNISHHLDLSSVLLAAENRVIPILQAKSALNLPIPDRENAPGRTIVDVDVLELTPVSPATDCEKYIEAPQISAREATVAREAIDIPKEWI